MLDVIQVLSYFVKCYLAKVKFNIQVLPYSLADIKGFF